MSCLPRRVRWVKGKKGQKGRRRNLLGKESGSNGVWSGSADTQGKRNRAKRNQDSATPLGNGTNEGQSLGKAVLGSASVEERQRGTKELGQNAVAQRPRLYSTKT